MNDNVRQCLHYTALGAEMVSRNVRALPFRPPFPTSAQDELADAERALEDALRLIRTAMSEYQAKETA